MEIACDESGSEGDNLVGGVTDVFAHASVRLSIESAAECVQEIRDRIRSPALEYKANHLLREKHRPVLVWLLSPAGPIDGHARVHLTEKSYFLLGKILGLLDATEDQARVIYREAPHRFGPDRWAALLQSFNTTMRAKNRELPAGPGLDLLVPAIIRAVDHWGAGGRPVSVVHDQQNLLTDERIARLKDILAGRLAGLRLVDSRSDARVQIADFLAGVARKIASEELNGRGDPELTALLKPFVDPLSVWGDDRSRSLLGARIED